ncbi:SAM-dependent methyltransferase [Streptacidiphilus sp. PAMC 29251]
MYDYYLGGKDNFPADREAAEQVLRIVPEMRMAARMNRAFLGRAIHYAASAGLSQFLDIGTGIPTAGNTHVVAQQVNPQARVAYVDNDPIVLTHARALMAGTGHGATHVVQADLREPGKILTDPVVQKVIDYDEPVALVLAAILHFIPDSDDPHAIVGELLAPLAPGSLLILSHGSWDAEGEDFSGRAEQLKGPYSKASAQLHLRSRSEIGELFAGVELIEPGLVPVANWRAEATHEEWNGSRGFYGGVGIKP